MNKTDVVESNKKRCLKKRLVKNDFFTGDMPGGSFLCRKTRKKTEIIV